MRLYEILLEAVTSANIADLYLIMVMPEPDSDAGKYTVREVTKAGAKEVTDTLEELILDEFDYVFETLEVSNILDLTGEEEWESDYEVPLEDVRDELEDYERELRTKPDMGPRGWNATGWIHLMQHLQEEDLSRVVLAVRAIVRGDGSTFDEASKAANQYVTGWRPETFEVVFDKFHFEGDYGGKPWANITKHVNALRKGKNPKDFLLKFDRVIDIVHNTGELRETFITKGDPSLAVILDVKAHAVDVRELRKFASPEIKRLFSDPNWRRAVLAQSQELKPDEERMTRGMQATIRKALTPGEGTVAPHVKGAGLLDQLVVDGTRNTVPLKTFFKYAQRSNPSLFLREFEQQARNLIKHISDNEGPEANRRVSNGVQTTRKTIDLFKAEIRLERKRLEKLAKAQQVGVQTTEEVRRSLTQLEAQMTFADRMAEVFDRLIQIVPHKSPIQKAKVK